MRREMVQLVRRQSARVGMPMYWSGGRKRAVDRAGIGEASR